METSPIANLIIAGGLIVFAAIFLFPRKTFTDQFIKDADNLRDAIQKGEIFEREERESELMDLIQMYKGRIEKRLYKEKLDDIYLAFNNRCVNKISFS